MFRKRIQKCMAPMVTLMAVSLIILGCSFQGEMGGVVQPQDGDYGGAKNEGGSQGETGGVVQPGDERFGLSIGGYDGIWPDDFRRMADIGAGVVHLGTYWSWIEYLPGEYDFSGLDAEVAEALANGLKPIVTISGASRRSCPIPGLSDDDLTICPPRPSDFQEFMEQLAKRYRGRVDVWEIWNEPEQPEYYYGAPDPAGYAQVLKAAYEGAKRGNPDAVVLFAGTGWINEEYVAQVLDSLGGAPAFDAVSVHPFRWPVGPYDPSSYILPDGSYGEGTLKEQLLSLTNLFSSYGYGWPDLYITDMGWGTNHEIQHEELNTLEEQADFISQTIEIFKTDPELSHVKSVVFFIERDSEATDYVIFSYFGLFYRDGSPKPSAYSFRRAVLGY